MAFPLCCRLPSAAHRPPPTACSLHAAPLLLPLLLSQDDPTEQLFVFFPEEAKVGVKTIKQLAERMRNENVQRAIMVTQVCGVGWGAVGGCNGWVRIQWAGAVGVGSVDAWCH